MPSTVTARVSRPFLIAILLAAIAPWAGDALAFSLQDYEGDVQLGEWKASLEGGFQFEDENSSTPPASFTLTRERYDEMVKIRNDGIYLIDPRLLTASAGVDLDLYQEQDRYSHGGSIYLDGLLWGYDASATLFPEWPENAEVFANQNQSVSNTTFGGRTRVNNENYGLLAQVLEDSFLKDHGLYYFTSMLTARTENFDERSTQLGETFRLDEQHDIVQYTAEKGFETSDLRFRYEFDNDREAGNYKLAYQTQNVGADYYLNFGPDLNRALDSDVEFYSRTGTGGAQQFLALNELLHIDHYQNLSTTYQYQFQYNDVAQFGVTAYQFGQFTLQHSLFQNVNESLLAGAIHQTQPTGEITTWWVGGEDGYTHSIPWSGMFFLDAFGEYEVEDDNLSSPNIHVTDEPHTAPPAFGTNIGFFLNYTFVLAATIVVLDNAHGARTPTMLHVDYDVLQIGNQTEIVPLPTSLVIHPGDPLLVSYTYQVSSKARFSTTSANVNVGVVYPWFDLYYSYESVSQNLLSGTGGQFLEHLTSNTVGGGVFHDWEAVSARADAIYQTVDSSNTSYNSTGLGQSATYRPGWNAVLTASGAEDFIDYTVPRHRARTYVFQFVGDRPIGAGGIVSVFANLRELEDSQIPTQREIQAGMQIRYIIGKLEMDPSISWYQRTFGPTTTQDLLLQIRVIRILF